MSYYKLLCSSLFVFFFFFQHYYLCSGRIVQIWPRSSLWGNMGSKISQLCPFLLDTFPEGLLGSEANGLI